MVAAAALDEDQVTSAVRFWEVLLEKVPVAMNAWVVPAAMYRTRVMRLSSSVFQCAAGPRTT